MTRARGTTNEAHRVEWRTSREGRKGGGKVDNQLSLCGSVLTNVPLDVYSSKGGRVWRAFGPRNEESNTQAPLSLADVSSLLFRFSSRFHPRGQSAFAKVNILPPFPPSLSFLSLFPSLSFLFLFPSLALLIAASSTSTSRGIAFVSG